MVLTISALAQGKILLLITNSDYQYTDVMMTYCYDRFLPQGMRWRDLFDMVCSAHPSHPPSVCAVHCMSQ